MAFHLQYNKIYSSRTISCIQYVLICIAFPTGTTLLALSLDVIVCLFTRRYFIILSKRNEFSALFDCHGLPSRRRKSIVHHDIIRDPWSASFGFCPGARGNSSITAHGEQLIHSYCATRARNSHELGVIYDNIIFLL